MQKLDCDKYIAAFILLSFYCYAIVNISQKYLLTN